MSDQTATATPSPAPGPAAASWRPRALRWAAVLLGLALLWTLLLGQALPRLIQPRLEAAASQALGAPLRLQRLDIAPWALRVGLVGLQLGPQAQPWLDVERVEADLSSESLWRLAPVLERLSIERPRLHLEREASGRLNIAPLLDKLAEPPATPPDPEAEPARFALHNLRLRDGELRLIDHAGGGEHRIEALQIGLPFLSNLPSQVAIDVAPELAARINGSPLALQAQSQPFSASQSTALNIVWRDIDLAWWARSLLPLAGAALPQPLPATLEAGRLDLALQLVFERPGSAEGDLPPRVQLRGEALIDGLRIDAPQHGGQLAWQRLHLRGLDLEPLNRRVALASLSLQGPAVGVDLARLKAALAGTTPRVAAADAAPGPRAPGQRAERIDPAAHPAAGSPGSLRRVADAGGTPPAPGAASAAATPAAPAQPWQWRLDALSISEGSLALDGAALAPTPALAALDLQPPPLPAAAAASAPAAAGGASAAAPLPPADAAPEPVLPAAPASDPAPAQHSVDAPLRVQALGLLLQGLRSGEDAPPARLQLQLSDNRGARLQLDGRLAPLRGEAELQTRLSDLALAPWLQALAPMLPAPLPLQLRAGRAGLAAQLSLQRPAQGLHLRLAEGQLSLSELDLGPAAATAAPAPRAPAARSPRGSGRPAAAAGRAAPRQALLRLGTPAQDRLRLQQLQLDGLRAELQPGAAPQLAVDRLNLDGLALAATRDARGQLPWLAGLLPAAADAPAPAPSSARPAAAPAGLAPRWSLGEFRCSGCSLRFDDAAVQPTATVALDALGIELRKLSQDLGQPIAFKLDTRAQGNGRLKLAGTVRPQPLKLQTRVDLSTLQLAVLQPYLDPHLNVVLARAELGARGELGLEARGSQPIGQVSWTGSAALERLLALDRLNDAEFLKLKALKLDGSRLRWSPDRLQADLGSILLDDFYGRVIVNADARLNLLDIVKRSEGEADRSLTTPQAAQAGSAPAQPAPAASAPAAPAAPAAPPPELRWQAIALKNGRIDFTDNFIKPNYSANLSELNGSLSAVAWDDPKPATVAIAGKVDGGAPLAIDGTLHPLGARLATDIVARAQGIELTRLSSYAGRYAGYGIEKGTLSVELRYRIEQGRLDASNKVVLNQLTFGEKVDSPDALKLPIQLAVSLLQDRHGVIDIDLPISGSLDDPQFSVGRVILRVIVNLIGKAITAPFSLIAKAFGGGADTDLGDLRFAPGSAELDEAARASLDKLAQALKDRPSLRLEATGLADPAQDVDGLRSSHVERALRAAKARATRSPPAELQIEPAERAKWLEAAYKSADLPGKPRNLVGLQKTLPPEEMEARLAAAAATGEPQLRALADERGNRVKAYLAGKLPADRVLLTRSRLVGEGGAAAPAGSASEPAAAPAASGGPRVIFSVK